LLAAKLTIALLRVCAPEVKKKFRRVRKEKLNHAIHYISHQRAVGCVTLDHDIGPQDLP